MIRLPLTTQFQKNNGQVLGIEPRSLGCRSSVLAITPCQPALSSLLIMVVYTCNRDIRTYILWLPVRGWGDTWRWTHGGMVAYWLHPYKALAITRSEERRVGKECRSR